MKRAILGVLLLGGSGTMTTKEVKGREFVYQNDSRTLVEISEIEKQAVVTEAGYLIGWRCVEHKPEPANGYLDLRGDGPFYITP